MKTLEVKNVSVTSRMDGRKIALACEWNGARYHVWMSLPEEAVEETVYKNPIKDGTGEKTRRLNGKTKPMQAIIAAMREIYKRDDLLKKFEAKEAAAETKRLARAHEQYAIDVKKEAGAELYEALKDLVEAIWDGRAQAEGMEKFTDPARMIIEKIDKKVKE